MNLLRIQQASDSSPLQQGVGVGIQPRTTGDVMKCLSDLHSMSENELLLD